MGRKLAVALMTTALVAVAAFHMQPSAVAADKNEQWVGTWSTALHAPNTVVFGTNPGFTNQTLRQIVHTSIGGDRVRVRLSTFGAGTLHVGAVHIAVRAAGAAIVPGTDRILRFGGQGSIVIPPGAVVLSDPAELQVPPLADLAVSIFVPGSTGASNVAFRSPADRVCLAAGRLHGERRHAVCLDHGVRWARRTRHITPGSGWREWR